MVSQALVQTDFLKDPKHQASFEPNVTNQNSRRLIMKSFIIAALVALSIAGPGALSANADSFAVHGYQGTHYGR